MTQLWKNGAQGFVLLVVLLGTLLVPLAANAAPRQHPTLTLRGVEEGQALRDRVVIEAQLRGAKADKVVFVLDGPQRLTHVEYRAPYFFGGGTNSNAKGWDTRAVRDGAYRLTVRAERKGKRVAQQQVRFHVANKGSSPGGSDGGSDHGGLFAKPQLTNPKTVHLSNRKPFYTGNGREDIVVVVDELITRPAAIRNVRHFVLIGGEFTIQQPIPQPDWPGVRPANNAIVMRHKALSFADIKGTGYVEGIHVNGTNGRMSEGIQIWGSSKGRIIIRNSRIEGVRTARADRDRRDPIAHCDLIHLMAGSLFLENVTLAGSEFQGLFMKAEHGNVLGDVRLRNVNVRDVERQPLWPYRFAGGGKLQEAQNVWVEAARRTGVEGGYLPREGRTITSDRVIWRGNPNVANGIAFNRGNPPQGDFAPAHLVGRRYTAGAFR
jgi:hypothetical protein